MNIRKLVTDDRAVSPVIGVILMVAITVILAAVIGTFVLGLGDQVSSTTPSASFNFDYTENTGGHDSLEVTHNGGDTLTASQVNASVSGAALESGNGTSYSGDLFGSSGDVTAGTTDTLDETMFTNTGGEALDLSGATVRVRWSAESGDNSAILGTWTGPDA